MTPTMAPTPAPTSLTFGALYWFPIRRWMSRVWQFGLYTIDEKRTRLVSRSRVRTQSAWARLFTYAIEPAGLLRSCACSSVSNNGRKRSAPRVWVFARRIAFAKTPQQFSTVAERIYTLHARILRGQRARSCWKLTSAPRTPRIVPASSRSADEMVKQKSPVAVDL